MANTIDQDTLLRDKRVLAEIDRHLWIESEKQGRDIGFDQAKEDWVKKFSKAWMSYHMPDTSLKNGKAKAAAKTTTRTAKRSKPKRRSAKSYMK